MLFNIQLQLHVHCKSSILTLLVFALHLFSKPERAFSRKLDVHVHLYTRVIQALYWYTQATSTCLLVLQ